MLGTVHTSGLCKDMLWQFPEVCHLGTHLTWSNYWKIGRLDKMVGRIVLKWNLWFDWQILKMSRTVHLINRQWILIAFASWYEMQSKSIPMMLHVWRKTKSSVLLLWHALVCTVWCIKKWNIRTGILRRYLLSYGFISVGHCSEGQSCQTLLLVM